MTLGGSWIFCADDTGANAELVVTRTDDNRAEKQETFKGARAETLLWRMVNGERKTSAICGYYDDCRDCPVGKAIGTGYTCSGWIRTHVKDFLEIYEEWGKTHGSNVQQELGKD